MSPTISTASKINTSPRKQILVERNESVQSSISFSNVKGLIMEDNESTPEIALQQQKASFSDVKSVIMKDTKLKPEIGPNQKKVSFSDVESIIIQGTESTLEISLNQVVSFSDVESVIMEDTDSKPDIGPNQKKVSFSDVESNGSIPEISLNQNVTFAFNDLTLPNSSHDSQISHHENEEPLKGDKDFDYKETENDSDPVPETLKKEKDSVNVDPTFKISPRGPISPSCPVLASFVSDPLMVPYDPKTNYLSPRPQFLHYRTNPRIELYREREGVQLDELYASESYSDTDVTAETPIEGSQRDLEMYLQEKQWTKKKTRRSFMYPNQARV
ncbi:uncharacterized protein LOC120175572 [Hibiscus syriacus]|uniref:uncharacterized protein LOC120175572 n=1 Tax=Hibiscus syriacus TaxID=106335 RepID=UPI0019211717|nr:uncharacterized protein LOC120175572 [Hibiscus syriacus]